MAYKRRYRRRIPRRRKRGRVFRRRALMEIGERVGTATCRKTLQISPTVDFDEGTDIVDQVMLSGRTNEKIGNFGYASMTTENQTADLLPSKTLYLQNLTLIERLSTYDPAQDPAYLNKRERDIVNLRGFRFRCHFQNTLQAPITLHFAIMLNKTENIWNPRFFNTWDKRGVNFSDNSLTGLDYQTLPVNRDDRVLLYHKRYKIAGNVQALDRDYITGAKNNWINISKWIPIKRQLTYKSEDEASCNDKIFLALWWSSALEPGQNPSFTTNPVGLPLDNLKGRVECVAYWRNPRTS